MIKSVTAFAPASVSNLGCGFDIMGFALDGPGDRVTARLNAAGKLSIDSINGDGGLLPYDPQKNTAGIAVQALLNKRGGAAPGIVLDIAKEMPFASGMGSSAASAAAAVTAVNHLLGRPLDETALLECVIDAETFISGGAHADNAAPALLGGMILARSVNPPDIIRLPVPPALFYVLLYPQVEVKTSEARALLPRTIPLKSAVQQWANTAALVHALHRADLSLLARAMRDVVAEPLRRKNIPCFDLLAKTALGNGALTFNISGSGPAVFAFCPSLQLAGRVAGRLKDVCRQQGIAARAWFGRIRPNGAMVTDVEN